MVRERPRTQTIVNLKDNEGNLKSDDKDLQEICTPFYSELYVAVPPPIAPTSKKSGEGSRTNDSQALRLNKIEAWPRAHLSWTQRRSQSPCNRQSPRSRWRECSILYSPLGSPGAWIPHDDQCLAPPGTSTSLYDQRAITLIHKSGPNDDLGNWRPITLLNSAYKIVAKALQIRLKPLLADLISPDQTAFVPHTFILDNVFVAHETLDIARRTKQPMLFLKVDFKKAFDKVSWPFLFASMDRLGIGPGFIDFTK